MSVPAASEASTVRDEQLPLGPVIDPLIPSASATLPLAGPSLAVKPRLALPPKPKSTRYQSLDIWRGAACLMLVFYHATFYAEQTWRFRDSSSWTVAGGLMAVAIRLWVGVPLFFVVSGYCIAASIDSLRRKQHSLQNYFVRRFRRIYPPLWIMGVLAVLITVVANSIPPLASHCEQLTRLGDWSIWNWLGNFTATEMWRPHLVGGPASYLLKNTWTLCYEEQFYAVTGAMLFLAASRFFTVAWLLAIATLASRHICRACGVEIGGFFFDGHWLMFAAGLLVYQCVNYLPRKAVLCSCGLLLLGMAYAVLDRRGSTDHFERHMDEYFFVAFGYAIALMFLKRWDAAITESRLLQPIRWCGKISYSIYLTHFLIVVILASALAMAGVTSEWQVLLITIPLSLAISIPVAWLFHLAVERHFMNAAM